MPCARPCPQIQCTGATQQKGFHLILAHPARERGKTVDQCLVALDFGRNQQFGQHLPNQQCPVAVLHGSAARSQSRLHGKRCKQPLAEGVNGLDPETAAGAIEHGGKAAARAGHGFGSKRRANRLQLRGELDLGKTHPAGENLVDARRHFGGTRLRESQAKDLLGFDTLLQKQAQNARGKDLRLAGPCGRR